MDLTGMDAELAYYLGQKVGTELSERLANDAKQGLYNLLVKEAEKNNTTPDEMLVAMTAKRLLNKE